jgi:acyl-CoA synthetase (NDP forming)
VLLNLENPGDVANAYQTLTELGGPQALVAKMAGPGLEWFVGGRQDEHFGPVVVVGMGGIYVEILRETAIRIAPVDHQEALRLLEEGRGAPLLAGVRGQKALDRESLADLVVRVSWLLHDFPEIRELDLNPIRLFEAGEGCCALDWRVTAAP